MLVALGPGPRKFCNSKGRGQAQVPFKYAPTLPRAIYVRINETCRLTSIAVTRLSIAGARLRARCDDVIDNCADCQRLRSH